MYDLTSSDDNATLLMFRSCLTTVDFPFKKKNESTHLNIKQFFFFFAARVFLKITIYIYLLIFRGVIQPLLNFVPKKKKKQQKTENKNTNSLHTHTQNF